MRHRNNIFKVLVLSLFLFNSTATMARADSKSAQNVDDLIVKSGLQRQVGQLPEVINATFDQRMGQEAAIKPDEAAKVKKVMAQSYNPAVMLDSIKERVAKDLKDKDIEAILVWLNAPLGEKITKLEEGASTAEAYYALQKFAGDLQNDPPDQARVKLLQQLDQAAHMTEFSVKLKMDMALTMTESMASIMGRKDFSRAKLMKELEVNRAQIEDTSKQEALISGLYTYQSLTDDELKQYIDFYNSDAGKKYANVITRGLLDVFEHASKDMGKNLGKLIQEEAKK